VQKKANKPVLRALGIRGSRMKPNVESFLEGYFHSFMYLTFSGTFVLLFFFGWVLASIFFVLNLFIFLSLRSWVSNSSTVHELIPVALSSADTMGFIINVLFLLITLLILSIIYFSSIV